MTVEPTRTPTSTPLPASASVLTTGRTSAPLPPRSGSALVRLATTLGVLGLVSGGLYAAGWRPQRYWQGEQTPLETVAVDRGDMLSLVVESGALESAAATQVRCQVEALVGTVGGAQGQGGMGGGAGGRGGAGGGGGGARGGGGSRGSGGARPGTGTAATKGAGGAGAAGGAMAGGGGAARAGGTSTASGGIIQKPALRSFSFVVAPHMPLRPATATNANVRTGMTMAQGGQGRPGGGGGGGGGGMMGGEAPGSTRILKILDEGSTVKAGEPVCWLDDSAFKDELDAQRIRTAQARSWVDQAESALEVAQIELKQYRDGVYPQDMELVTKYIDTCRIKLQQDKDRLDWEQDMASRNLRSDSQVRGAEYAVERSTLALREAEGMKERLVNFAAPRLIRNLEAKINSVEADLQAQRAALALEEQRQRRLEKAIASCVLNAPSDGLIVYVNQSNGWGRVETQIREGVTVRENQPIFMVPDLTHMRVKARINEAKVALIQPGTPALIRVDSAPDQLFKGRVTEVTPISTPLAGPFSDVKVYFAMVEIEGSPPGLRSGQSAQVEFLIDRRDDVNRVPVKAVRWFDGQAFVARPGAGGLGYTWQAIELGLINAGYAEVRKGLDTGALVVADPASLAPPTRAEREAAKVADLKVARAGS